MNQKFNIFEILSKDDKEIVHSAFLKFIFEEQPEMINEILGVSCKHDFNIEQEVNLKDKLQIKKIKKKIKNNRIDLFLSSKNTIILIENKFKSLPSLEQLEAYDEILENRNKFIDDEINRILICFEYQKKKIGNWKVIKYSEILAVLKKNQNKFKNDEHILVKHYIKFLEKYIEKYKSLHNPESEELIELFESLKEKKSNRNFWLKIIYSEIGIKFEEEKFEIKHISTKTPAIDVIPKNWAPLGNKNSNFYIQFQGDCLKFYFSYQHDDDFSDIIKDVKTIINKLNKFPDFSSGTFKKLPKKSRENKRTDSSFFVYMENILDNDDLRGNFTVEEIYNYINKFYKKINKVLDIN